MLFKCIMCDNQFEFSPWRYKQGYKKTCSIECKKKYKEFLAKQKSTSIEVKCSFPGCNKAFLRRQCDLNKTGKKSGYYFCSKKHQIDARYYLEDFKSGKKTDGKASYRTFGLKLLGEKCEGCGYDEYSLLLDVHHLDGNRNNNKLENLMVLCPMCHAKVTRKLYKIVDKKLTKALEIDRESVFKYNHLPNAQILKEDVKQLGYYGTGRKYNVSDACIRSRIKFVEKLSGGIG